MPSKRKAARRRVQKRQSARRSRTNRKSEVSITKRDHAAGEWFARLVALQARLRSPNGCPWDREQTHASLRKYLIEEAYEVLDAMDSSDPRKFASELGDLLLQVVFHANIAKSQGRFGISDVIEAVYTKMVRRHPHVFGDVVAKTPGAVLKNWEQIKAAERAAEKHEKNETREKNGAKGDAKPESILADVPRSMNIEGVLDKLEEERRELLATLPGGDETSEHTDARSHAASLTPEIEEEVGDLLFAGVNVARFVGIDPEIALKKANHKFKQRFQWMESAAAREGHRLADVPRERMEELWNESKAVE